MVLLGGNLDHCGFFIRFVKVLDAENLRNFTFSVNRKAHWSQTLKLNFEKSLDNIVFSDWRYFNCNFDLSSLFLSDFEPDFFKVLEPFITSD